MPSEPPFFTVVAPRARWSSVETPYVLERDRWDDFGFKTQYQLFRSEDRKFIGSVKILRRGQTPTPRGLLTEGTLAPLDRDFCSIGQSLDYYQRIAELPREESRKLLRALRDVVANPRRADRFRSEPGWSESLRREIPRQDEFDQLAAVLLTRNYGSLGAVDLDLTFSAPGWLAPLRLRFDAPPDDDLLDTRPPGGLRNRYKLPRRIVVLTGRNGSGKSTVLARLARVLHASQRDRRREALQSLGELEPESVGFSRVIVVSYSAFDAFEVPGLDVDERRQIASDIREGAGRYIFCGLRDISRELDQELADSEAADAGGASLPDRRTSTLLKPLEELAAEFSRTLKLIERLGRWPFLEEVMDEVLLKDPSFNDLASGRLPELLGDDAFGAFLSWSTGHKIVMHIMAALVAYTEPRSFLLIDEPESHLHPPLLAALMHGVRYVLEERDAFAICATHSPVVVQETLARHVHIVRREGSQTNITSPRIETFGESIGEITDEVFGLNTDATDFHTILRKQFETDQTVEAVASRFEHGLSLQARAYLMTLAVGGEDDDDDSDYEEEDVE